MAAAERDDTHAWIAESTALPSPLRESPEMPPVPSYDDRPMLAGCRRNHSVRSARKEPIPCEPNLVTSGREVIGDSVWDILVGNDQHVTTCSGRLGPLTGFKFNGRVNVVLCETWVLSQNLIVGVSRLMEIRDRAGWDASTC